MTNRRFGLLLYRWHAWAGLLSGLFLIFICVTGSVAVFKPEIERALDWGGYAFDVKPNGRSPISIETAIATAIAKHPDSRATLARWPAWPGTIQGHGPTYAVSLDRPAKLPNITVLVDPYENRVVAEKVGNQGWAFVIRQMHLRFYYGQFWGRWIVGFFGIVLTFATISGLFIYSRFNAKAWLPKFRPGRGIRILMADLHKIVGLGSLVFNLVFGVTGAVIGLEGLYLRYFPEPKAAIVKRESVKDLAPGTLDRVARLAVESIPGSTPTFVTLNHNSTGTFRVNVEVPTRALVRENSSHVVFDAKTLEPITVTDARNEPTSTRLHYAMEPLHFGRLGGWMWVKLLWAGMGLSGGFLAISGFIIYIVRQRKHRMAATST